MRLSVFFTFVVVLLCYSCVTDPSQKQGASETKEGPRTIEGADGRVVVIHDTENENNEKLKKKFEQPQIKQVSIDIKIPSKEDWYLLQEKYIDGFSPVGIAYHNTKVFITDTVQQKLVSLTLTDGLVETMFENLKVSYINQRKSRLIMPMYDLDSIFLFRGGTKADFTKIQLPYKLSHPTCFEGFRIDNFVIVDQGNHRVIRNKGGEYNLIGSYGAGREQFDSPTSIVMSVNKIYVTDTGNSRVQIIDEENNFVSSFGSSVLKRPTGICSDGKHVFVCDEALKAIMVFLPSGKLLYKLDKLTQAPSDLYFNDGRLYVADKEGSTIKVLGNKVYSN